MTIKLKAMILMLLVMMILMTLMLMTVAFLMSSSDIDSVIVVQ